MELEKDSKNKLTIFTFHNKDIEVITEAGEPYFKVRDIANAIECDRRSARRIIEPEETKSFSRRTEGGTITANYVDELNLYKIIFRSNKPQAKDFSKWIVKEVIPTLRRTSNPVKENKPYIQALYNALMTSKIDTLSKEDLRSLFKLILTLMENTLNMKG